jgi:hypothetical protein
MAHPRELISDAVVALLLAANTAAGSRVSATRVDPHKKSQLPALSVYTLTDPTSDGGSSEMEEGHELALEVAAWAEPDEIEDLLDQVEDAMRADPYFGGVASDSILKGTVTQVVEIDGRSDPTVAIAVLTYSVTYHIALAAT